MIKTLVIVESPAKAKTIKKYLPKGFEVEATMGHVIDLPKSRIGINIENNFAPEYIKIRGKAALLKSLKSAAKKADQVYLATDPDREGEAISWHMANFLEIDLTTKCRIEFHEVTKKAVNAAIENKREIDIDLVNSQQARRILDRLVGYSLSPFLWKKVKKGLSGGRVQSVVTRIIVDREEEIEAFIPEEYWNLELLLKKTDDPIEFISKFYSEDGKKKTITIAEEAQRLEKIVDANAIIVDKVKKRIRYQKPPVPFTTSTLQQEAYKVLGYTTQRTMRLAQQLYEGVEIKGSGLTGLITYLRTDSTRIADEAVLESKAYIKQHFGDEYLGSEKKVGKKKNVQDAHEAIRPSSIMLTPEKAKESLEPDQYRLYKLIWERLLCSQMSDAQYYVTDVDIACNNLIFKTKGETQKFDGFTRVNRNPNKSEDSILPELSVGDDLIRLKTTKEQKYTKPPARYTEASLVKILEEKGIGRPSTYAPTIATIKNRDYVEVIEKHFKPTELGVTVTHLMKEYFSDVVNISFTADMEDRLDSVSEGKTDWVELLRNFYGDFEKALTNAQEKAEAVTIADPESDEDCELCGRRMVIKKGKYGRFLACPGFPECKNTKPFFEKTGGICSLCGGDIVKRTSKTGRTFYSCNNYPDCDYMNWDMPIPEKCPVCGSTLFQKGLGKRKSIYCDKKDCGYKAAPKE
ncbi:type I DNA topoisomerase [Acetobacterium woodii]|uniref:DNA topoisomerase 1 n=1 Tax=Acetobacterium woodii (strain ATCC 29683 / DSM 1030 / JCM 2381 / KCTC 1655 / WB1) TaxID=931626 RepID=H6LJW1_ACEWD|nr:type I DNA topoisomerase [Acetobacterium woodii]AFA48715.1 DNA topoisomerase II [Acetobacterium woodii DSM 1030]